MIELEKLKEKEKKEKEQTEKQNKLEAEQKAKEMKQRLEFESLKKKEEEEAKQKEDQRLQDFDNFRDLLHEATDKEKENIASWLNLDKVKDAEKIDEIKDAIAPDYEQEYKQAK